MHPGGSVVHLRPVEDADAAAYFAFQQEPDGNAMAAFPARDREAYDRHWAVLRANDTGLTRTATVDGEFVGIVTAWGDPPERELAYWFGQRYWGRGFATDAVAQFLTLERTRPLTARVAEHNVGSRRVLEKLGFRWVRKEPEEDVTLDVFQLS